MPAVSPEITAADIDFQRLDAELTAAGLDTSQFGFYDQPSSIAPKDLHRKYARWVSLRPRDAAYDAHVRAVVPMLCHLIIAAFEADNWHGGCVEASTMMSRMLDRLGVWSFSVLGSTTFEVETLGLACGFYKHDFQDFQDAVLGHAWVVIPPYGVVDATVCLQQWGDDPITQFLPEFVAEETVRCIAPDVSDVVSWRMRNSMSQMDEFLDPQLHLRLEPDLLKFGMDFPAVQIADGPLNMRYVPVEIFMSEGPLETINEGGVIGRTGGQIWDQVVGPEFDI
jgi:hypothetical protein